MAKIYLNVADSGACSHYRARLPARHCTEQLRSEGIELVCSEQFDPAANYDAVVLHRVVHPRFMPELERLQKSGTKIVIELDDDVWHVPKWNPASRVFGDVEIDTLDWSLDLADQIWVSTEPLAKVVNRPDKTKVLPNLVDPGDFTTPTEYDDGRVRVLWAGSIHHDADLAMIAPAVEVLIERYRSKVQFLFFGHWPESLSQWVKIKYTNLATLVPRKDLAPSLAYVDPVDLSEYPATLCGLGADIGLCPLVDERFNHSKSGIKAWEYTLAGAVPVVTDLPPYRGFSQTVHIDNWITEWVHVVDKLIWSADLRKQQLEEARLKVLGEHSWQSPGKDLWLDAFRSLAKGV